MRLTSPCSAAATRIWADEMNIIPYAQYPYSLLVNWFCTHNNFANSALDAAVLVSITDLVSARLCCIARISVRHPNDVHGIGLILLPISKALRMQASAQPNHAALTRTPDEVKRDRLTNMHQKYPSPTRLSITALLRHDDGIWDNPQGAFAWTDTRMTRENKRRMTQNGPSGTPRRRLCHFDLCHYGVQVPQNVGKSTFPK